MNKAEDKKQGDGGRFKGTTFQDLLDQEAVEVPEFLRLQSNPHLGDEDLSVDRYISQEFLTSRRTACGPKCGKWFAGRGHCRTGDHHVITLLITASSLHERPPRDSRVHK